MNDSGITCLRECFERAGKEFDFEGRIKTDPVSFPSRFTDPDDVETACLISAVLSYGNVKIILKNLSKIFDMAGPHPARFISDFDGEKAEAMNGIYHRFNNSDDLKTLLWAMGKLRKEYGGLENLFLQGYRGKFHRAEDRIRAGLDFFSDRFLETAEDSPFRNRRSFSYFFPRPSAGSACKRLCLFLRWAVRSGPVDMGIWKNVDPAHLIIPVDTHIARIARYLGLTMRKSADWKMAVEISKELSRITPEDPLKFDFMLCHTGISGECSRNLRKSSCSNCHMSPFCSRFE